MTINSTSPSHPCGFMAKWKSSYPATGSLLWYFFSAHCPTSSDMSTCQCFNAQRGRSTSKTWRNLARIWYPPPSFLGTGTHYPVCHWLVHLINPTLNAEMTTASTSDISGILQAPLQFEETLNELIFAGYCVVATGSVSIEYSISDFTRRMSWDGQAWLWESLNSIDEDVALFQRFPVSLTHVIYILAKWATFYTLPSSWYSSMLIHLCEQDHCLRFPHFRRSLHRCDVGFEIKFLRIRISDLWSMPLIVVVSFDICAGSGKICVWLLALCILFSSLLFLIRVLAIFHHSKAAQSVFIFLWVGYIGTSLVLPLRLNYGYSARFHDCLPIVGQQFVTYGIALDVGYHTLVLLATSLKLLTYSLAESWSERLRVFWSGEGMSQLSRVLIQTDQLYYLWVVFNEACYLCFLISLTWIAESC